MFVTAEELTALASVIMIDLVMAGDNAIVIGMAAAGLPMELRRRAIMLGIAAATVLRIAFASVTLKLLTILGLTLAGGLLLLWVAWKMWREIRIAAARREAAHGGAHPAPPKPAKTLSQAMVQIVIADVSMSLDNILAVAGASRDHLWVLVVGLVLSIALMGAASTVIARMLERHHWLAYVGLAIVAYVAVDMVWRGAHEIIQANPG